MTVLLCMDEVQDLLLDPTLPPPPTTLTSPLLALQGYTCSTSRNRDAHCVCYWVTSTNHTYHEAQVACQAAGGTLAVPNSQQTSDFIDANLTFSG